MIRVELARMGFDTFANLRTLAREFLFLPVANRIPKSILVAATFRGLPFLSSIFLIIIATYPNVRCQACRSAIIRISLNFTTRRKRKNANRIPLSSLPRTNTYAVYLALMQRRTGAEACLSHPWGGLYAELFSYLMPARHRNRHQKHISAHQKAGKIAQLRRYVSGAADYGLVPWQATTKIIPNSPSVLRAGNRTPGKCFQARFSASWYAVSCFASA